MKKCDVCEKEFDDILENCPYCATKSTASVNKDLSENPTDETRATEKVEQKTIIDDDSELQSKVFCKHCGNEIVNNNDYCNRCGRDIYDESKKHCTNCGKVLEANQTYCDKCGQKVSTIVLPKSVSDEKNKISKKKIITVAIALIIFIGMVITGVKLIPENCVIVAISGATAGRCAINKIRTTTNQHCLNLEIDEDKASYKYIFYCVSGKFDELIAKKQGARGDLNSSLVLGLKIPLPSLEVQNRIVHVLDNFNAICSDLNTGLPAEIEARRKQYEYYRDKLLNFQGLSK